MAERYEESALTWYFACRNSGRMDRDAAKRAVLALLPGTGDRIPIDWTFPASRFFLLIGQPKESLVQLNRRYDANKQSSQATSGNSRILVLFIALVADMVGNQTVRDRMLEEVGKLSDSDVHLKTLAESMRTWLSGGSAPDQAAIQGAITTMAANQRADCEFFAAWFLANRGQTDRAVKLWQRCLKSDVGTNWLRTHAHAFVEQYEKKAKQ